MAASKISRPPARAALVKTVTAALDDMKATNIKVMDVRQVTDVSDCMVLASGNSDRHVKSIADRVVERAKAAGFRAIGVEGQRDGEWVLVDLNDVLVHVMLPRVREFYGLEELWETAPAAKPRPKAKAKPKPKAGNRSGAAARKSAPAKGKSRPARGAPARKSAPARGKRAGKSARPRG
jgi:ribosome-associated protein